MDDALFLEFVKSVRELGWPIAHHSFSETQKMPFVVYLTPDSDNFFADGKVYKEIENVDIELYTDGKEKPRKEERLMVNLLESLGLAWEKNQIYIPEENMTKTTYETRFL